MVVTITPLGGIGEVGRNCVAVDVDGDIFICDMGFHLERFISVTQDDYPHKPHLLRRLLAAKAIPDKRWLVRRKQQIKGICISHAHLDHVGGVFYLAKQLNCPVYATPFAANVIRHLCTIARFEPPIQLVEPGQTVHVGPVGIEFIEVSHSTPESCILAFHTPKDGVVVYANDYKNDQTPPFGKPTDVSRLKELSGKVSFLILDSLYAHTEGHCESEIVAREEVLALAEKLKDKRAIVASTFSSHIYRLKTLVELAKNLGREPIFIGRSLANYLSAAKHIAPELLEHTQLKFRGQIDRFLAKLPHPEKYFLIVTGHQGEENAVLSRMAKGVFDFQANDAVVFSCKTIPTKETIENRARLEKVLATKNVELILDVHVSGHAHAQDHRDIFNWLKPKFMLPSHAEADGEKAMFEMLKEFPEIRPVRLRLQESFSF